MSSAPQLRYFSVPLESSYLLEAPAHSANQPLTAIALHGYGQNPEDMLRLTRRMLGPDHWIASVRGPHPFSLQPLTTGSPVGYNWGTPGANWTAAIRLHHAMLLAVLGDLESVTECTPARTMLIGFSQPVGLNYRFARAHPDAVRGIIGICGGVPKDWEDLQLSDATAAILHISRSEDEFYPLEQVHQFADRLKSRSKGTVEFHLLPGPHRFPSQAGEIVRDWIANTFKV